MLFLPTVSYLQYNLYLYWSGTNVLFFFLLFRYSSQLLWERVPVWMVKFSTPHIHRRLWCSDINYMIYSVRMFAGPPQFYCQFDNICCNSLILMIWIRSFHSHVPCNIISMSCSNFHSSGLFSHARVHLHIYIQLFKACRSRSTSIFCFIYFVYNIAFFRQVLSLACPFARSLASSFACLLMLSCSLSVCLTLQFLSSSFGMACLVVLAVHAVHAQKLCPQKLSKYEEPLITVQVTSFLYENFYFLMTLMAMIKMWL